MSQEQLKELKEDFNKVTVEDKQQIKILQRVMHFFKEKDNTLRVNVVASTFQPINNLVGAVIGLHNKMNYLTSRNARAVSRGNFNLLEKDNNRMKLFFEDLQLLVKALDKFNKSDRNVTQYTKGKLFRIMMNFLSVEFIEEYLSNRKKTEEKKEENNTVEQEVQSEQTTMEAPVIESSDPDSTNTEEKSA